MYDTHIHSFITKIWLEESAEEAGRPVWRGMITHIPSGNRHWITDLEDIPIFVARYLEAMGVRLGLWWKIQRWLERTKSKKRHGRDEKR